MIITVVIASALGAVLASLLACVPGLHVYNVMGMLVIGIHAAGTASTTVPAEIIVPFTAGMIVGFAMVNSVPSILLAAPDESAFFTVLPGQKFLMAGRGYEGVMITAGGGLAGLMILVMIAGPIAPRVLPLTRAVFQPHMHWILWCVICFMIMSEWPKTAGTGRSGWMRLRKSWRTTGAGLMTFSLSGLLGFILMYRSPIASRVAFQNLMPAFVGLFTMPWLILNIISHTEIPPQVQECSHHQHTTPILRGAIAGGLGGGFAAFFPAITGGVGGFLAGHATGLHDDREFLASQGTSKMVYYVGGLMLLFVPGVHMTRGGGARMICSFYLPHTYHDYCMFLASIAIAGVVAFSLVGPMAQFTISLIRKCGYRQVSFCALILVLTIVIGVTGWIGLAVMIVGTGIGLIPVLFGSRRMNCLGIILLPLACNMSGAGVPVARMLGLL